MQDISRALERRLQSDDLKHVAEHLRKPLFQSCPLAGMKNFFTSIKSVKEGVDDAFGLSRARILIRNAGGRDCV